MSQATYTGTVRSQRNALEMQVMGLLEWDLQLYCMFKYECGLAYLTAYLNGDADAIDQMQRSALYWGWWKLHWMKREQGFVERVKRNKGKNCVQVQPCDLWTVHVHGRQGWYRIINDPQVLAQAMTPDGHIMEDSYCTELVAKINKSLTALSQGERDGK